MDRTIAFSPVGDCALAASFGSEIKPEINRRIRQLISRLEEEKVPGLVELVPTYCSLLVQYDPEVYSYRALCKKIRAYARADNGQQASAIVRVVELPVVYGGEFGPDIDFVCRHTGFTEEELIRLHSGTDYLVYMLGFIPGFTYLGGMDSRLATPRLKTPRTLIPAGSVGIAGAQTGTYPADSPGGWQIIGRTPLLLYDGSKTPPTLLTAGDYVRYVPVTAEEFFRIKENRADYTPVIHECREVDIRGTALGDR